MPVIKGIGKLLGWLGTHAASIGKASAETVAKAAPEAKAGLRGWWGKIGKGAGNVSEHTDDILRDMSTVRNTVTEQSAKIEDYITTARKSLLGDISRLDSERKAAEAEANRLLRKITQNEQIAKSKPEQAKEIMRATDVYKEERQRLLDVAKGNSDHINQLAAIQGVAEQAGGESTALAMMRNNPRLQSYPGVIEWQSSMNSAFKLNEQILRTTSKNLGNDYAFLQEYLKLNRTPGKELERKIWLANPKNSQKIADLMSKEKISKIIEKGFIPFRYKITGLTLSDQAKRLGITSAVAAGSAGAISVYNWFNRNEQHIESEAVVIKDALNGFNASGPGKTILDGVKTSMNNINSYKQLVRTGLSDNAEETIMKYVTGMTKELQSLNSALNRWDMVIKTADKPDVARQAQTQLSDFIYHVASEFNELAKQVGAVPVQVSAPKMTGKADDNILKVQQFLSQKINPNIKLSGKLDPETIKMLGELEDSFNKRAEDTKFTGVFVNPAANYVISYDNLVEAFNRIKRY